MSEQTIRVLVVDDSAVARDLIERGLSREPGITVVGKASDAFSARDKIVYLTPDVMTLDVQMPKMDGIEFLKRLMPQYPIPVVVVSAITSEGSAKAMEALDAGAIAVVAKPSGSTGLIQMIGELAEAVREASKANRELLRKSLPLHPEAHHARATGGRPETATIVAIGASTGGTTALHRVISALPADFPATLVVQHMPPVFTRMFAESLDRTAALRVKEATDGEPVLHGTVYIAPGDRHMRLAGRPGGFTVRMGSDEKINGHRPSVDALFHSVAAAAGDKAAGLILTGMGRDGAEGLLAMRKAGARCLAQDEASSIVFGMPKEAYAIGAAERMVPLDKAAEELIELTRRGKRER